MFAADPNAAGNDVTVLGVQRPAQIVNYRSIGSTPVILAVGLAVGAVVALASPGGVGPAPPEGPGPVRSRSASRRGSWPPLVAWQATVIAVIGIIVGVPLGIVLGRQLWTLFARNIDAVPDPTVPVVSGFSWHWACWCSPMSWPLSWSHRGADPDRTGPANRVTRRGVIGLGSAHRAAATGLCTVPSADSVAR